MCNIALKSAYLSRNSSNFFLVSSNSGFNSNYFAKREFLSDEEKSDYDSSYLENTQINYVETFAFSGFQFNNPNAQKSCGCGSSFAI